MKNELELLREKYSIVPDISNDKREYLIKEKRTEKDIVVINELNNMVDFLTACVWSDINGDFSVEFEYLLNCMNEYANHNELRRYVQYLIGVIIPMHEQCIVSDFNYTPIKNSLDDIHVSTWCDLVDKHKNLEKNINDNYSSLITDLDISVINIIDKCVDKWCVLVGINHYFIITKRKNGNKSVMTIKK